ncbi:hypothetical protein IQ241_18680 [Romeria aff. gracilis LEGE 07310]|uniref:Uncharacterized protein n=1 Tax=Vasconcelosia minhoensis LEGE 07310 TaxID=915328 RepID=A0A8J7DMS9_9CYAN|nr:hypothetical protein [Romeria gracilis]MBE9079296.1 hypothetical protein [Romeria aff. gracilis LEGE 07310]
MATANVLKFMQKTAEDESLRQRLGQILECGDGDISSEAELDSEESAALKGERAPAVTEFAAENGYEFSTGELITVVDAFQQHQAGQISDSEMAQIMGLTDAKTLKTGTQSSFRRLTQYLTKTYLGV